MSLCIWIIPVVDCAILKNVVYLLWKVIYSFSKNTRSKKMTVKEIKKNLLNIRMFYLDYDFYLSWRKKGINNRVFDLVEKYNRVMENAPVVLLRTFIGLYCEAKTQKMFAEDIGYSVHSVNNWNMELINYLQKNLQ